MSSIFARWVALDGPAFRTLWLSQSISELGSQFSLVAIPLVAVITLDATPLEMGFLGAAETVPYLVLSLPAGVLVDRISRHRLLLVTNLGRAALLFAIPLAAVGGALSLGLLYPVALAVGCLNVVFDVAFQSYVPELLSAERLVAGNQRLELSASAARTAGPSLGGLLVGAFGGAVAVALDAISYVAASVVLLRAHAPATTLKGDGQVGPRADEDWRAGLRVVMGDRVLRDLAGSTAIFNLASSAIIAVFILFVVREAGLAAGEIGLLLGIGNVGFLVGASLIGSVTRRLGVGNTLALSAVLAAVATALFPLAHGPFAIVALLGGRLLGAASIPLFNVHARSLRQSRAANAVMGRVNAVFRLVDWGPVPIGALLGGWMGNQFGLRPTLAIGAALATASAAWLVASPARRLTSIGAGEGPDQRDLFAEQPVRAV